VIKLILIILLTAGFNTLAGQETGRPLRTINTEENINIEKPLPISNYSMLTEAALAQPLTRQYIEQYTRTSGIAYLNTIMLRAYIYMPFIREEIKKRNLPPELVYLPVIESSFQITARSRSGAMGLWQFMMNSISPFDIKVTDMIDERKDFVKSTRGALQKLENEYKVLGCWELTLAAYNSGLGGMRRTIQNTGIRDYWELSEKNHLRNETKNYIPKFYAAIYVLSQPRRFGINVWHKNFEWVSIPLPRQIHLDILADEAGINRDLMRRLNAELLHGISPMDSNYRLKIPASHQEQVTAVLERSDLRLIRYHSHVISRGDTLWSMSRRYGTTVAMIEQHNPGISGRVLRVGETIIIPAFGDAPPRPVQSIPQVQQNSNGTHVVQKGETFWSISRLYGISPQALAEANGMLIDHILNEGRTLNVPIIN